MGYESFEYVGLELDLFAHASHWRAYWSRFVMPFLGDNVLEVGAGIGSATTLLHTNSGKWTALEPDENLAKQIDAPAADPTLTVVTGSITDLPSTARFDTVLYIDVLEHIADDRAELAEASARLDSGGYLVVLAPAHQWLFSPFDASVGHYRRYSKKMLRRLAPAGVTEVQCKYLDSIGTLLSGANRLLLRSSLPTNSQIQFWDRRIIPVTRILDPVLGHNVGKSVLMVWQKQ